MDDALGTAPQQWEWLGNLYEILPLHVAIAMLVIAAMACAFIVGVERELRRGPVGLRALALVATASCLFTVAGLLLAGSGAPPTALVAAAALGAGLLATATVMREHGPASGLSDAGTLWSVAALGVLAGAGFAAAAIALAVLVVTMLVGIGLLEERARRRCRFVQCRVHYKRERGRTGVQILKVLDRFGIPDADWKVAVDEDGDSEDMDLRYCHYHAAHRAVLYDIAAIPAVKEIDRKRAARDVRGGGLDDVGTASR